ncbi:MAG TPA: dihydroorotate dehydrogenase electron transfer subunit [Deltaproteobacteria bacterium]|nr:dihydroorotate dehydrogenase electron transfer subunit [Deltaproteobacteria bacterium]
MKEVRGVVRDNTRVAHDTFLLSLDCDLPVSRPGQFVMLQVACGYEPFLRRPFAILGNQARTLEILYKIKGHGTRLLAEKRTGDNVNVLGPLGKGFSVHDGEETIVYMAGGTGLPPILSLAENLRQGILILGVQSKDQIPLLSRISSLPGVELKLATIDGSCGRMGLATDVLDDVVCNVSGSVKIYACGPKGMLLATSECAKRIGAWCEVSLEEFMSCGFGVCTGCVVETTGGNRRVCREGPVFNAQEILF